MYNMHDFGPAFIDVTWGAGGSRSQITCEMVHKAQTFFGLETCMHLTCTDMPSSKIDEALEAARTAGCTNILALRGDPREKRRNGRLLKAVSDTQEILSNISSNDTGIGSTLVLLATRKALRTIKIKTC